MHFKLLFSSYYENVYNSVCFDSIECSNLHKTVNNKICNECINHAVNVNDVENAINKLKPGKSDGFQACMLVWKWVGYCKRGADHVRGLVNYGV